jgi:hypothetical protein
MSFTASPASRRALAVPPVEINSTPAAARVRANSTRPVLSETESNARWIFAIGRTRLWPRRNESIGKIIGKII